MSRGGKREGAGRKPGSHGADRRLFLSLIDTMRDEGRSDSQRLVAALAVAEALLPVGLRSDHTNSKTARRGLFAAAAARLDESEQPQQRPESLQ
jgi:hypothetical protein